MILVALPAMMLNHSKIFEGKSLNLMTITVSMIIIQSSLTMIKPVNTTAYWNDSGLATQHFWMQGTRCGFADRQGPGAPHTAVGTGSSMGVKAADTKPLGIINH